MILIFLSPLIYVCKWIRPYGNDGGVTMKGFFIGLVCGLVFAVGISSLFALDFGKVVNYGEKISKGVSSISATKTNLEKDVVNLKQDAVGLIKNKDSLLQIKNQLLKLADETQKQIGEINSTVKVVEQNLVKTEQDIASTSSHVQDIDKAKKILQ